MILSFIKYQTKVLCQRKCLEVIPSAICETEQDKQDQYHRFQLPLTGLYLLPLCLVTEEPESRTYKIQRILLSCVEF